MLRAFNVTKDVIGYGPPPSEQLAWLWSKDLEWDDIDADVILEAVGNLQPEAPDTLRQNPALFLDAFIGTVPEINYAGVSREFCNPEFKTLEEYFKKGIANKGKFPMKKKRKKEEPIIVENENFEWEDLKDSKASIKCDLCQGITFNYEEGENIGLQHFVIIDGKKCLLEGSPICGTQIKKHKKENTSSKKIKTKALGHSFGNQKCFCCQRQFKIPEDSKKFNDHLNDHINKFKYTNLETNLSNQMRLRSVIEGFEN